ncbi:MAG: cytochrome c maturation protein CcmE [Myxococcota bacterium]|nr:cytochrome c maturation protein CcmE [Myxococcota bacterium]
MTPTTQRRLFLGGALVIAGLALGVVSFADIGENLVYYWDPTQLEEAGDKALGADIRLGGVVVAGSLDWNEASGELSFEVSDGLNTVPVHNSGAPPAMFREGIGVVVEGTLTASGTFESDRLMVKHSNEYRAPEEGVAPEDLYKTVEGI